MKRTNFTQISRWFVTAFLIASFLSFSSQQVSAERPTAPASIQLVVDTELDFNDLTHQACTVSPNDCSLRGAISRANKDTSWFYEIILPAGTYSISISGTTEDANATGDLDILTNMALTGAGANSTVIDTQAIDRVFQIHPGASLTMQGVTVTGGRTKDGEASSPGGDSEEGGGFYNNGSLVLKYCIVISNGTGTGGSGLTYWSNGGKSGRGGGIYNTGWVTFDHTELLDNYTGMGGAGYDYPFDYYWGNGGNSGDGGGIYNTGQVWLKDSRLVNNYILPGGTGGSAPHGMRPGGGDGGSGGGIYNTGFLIIERTAFVGNLAGDGGIASGDGGSGGGIFNTGVLEMNHSQVVENESGLGTGGCTGGLGGRGGGIFTSGQATLSGVLIENNHTGDGGPGGGYYGCRGGSPGGDGGGIYNSGILSVDYVTIHGNITGRGGGGYSWPGAGGAGGGIYNTSSVVVWNSNILENRTGAGGNGNGLGGYGGNGGGIYNSGDLTLTYSPVLSNTAGQGGLGSIYPGQGGSGGGIYNAGRLASRFSPVTANTAGSGGSGGTGIYGKGGDGGGIYNANRLDLLGIVMYKNKAGPGGSPDNQSGDGGGIFVSTQGTLTLTNAIVAENLVQPGGKGSGLYLGNSATLIHTTLSRNTGGDGSGIYFTGSTLVMTNTILVSQTVGITAPFGSSIDLDSTLWGTGSWSNLLDLGGSGTYTTTHDYYGNPTFVDPFNADYHLLPFSPAIDLGVQTGTTVDIDNQPRPNPSTDIPDLGADEYWLFVPASGVTILGSTLISATLDVTYTAIISPPEATPNFTYFWSPEPDIGQGSDTVVYNFLIPGINTVTVTAWNVGSTATASFPVSVVFGPHPMFLPMVALKGLLSP